MFFTVHPILYLIKTTLDFIETPSNFSLEQLEHKNEGVNVSESYAMHLVFLCVIEVCTALDVLILDRISKSKVVTNPNDLTVTDVKHHDKTGLGSESWKHNQPLDVETEGILAKVANFDCNYRPY